MSDVTKAQLEAIAKYLECEVKQIVSARDAGEHFVVLVDKGIAGTPRYYISPDKIKPEPPKPKAAPETRTRKK